ncbi:MAG: type III secretion protein L [Lentisphaeria bacterium]|jgi:type III secretion protein L
MVNIVRANGHFSPKPIQSKKILEAHEYLGYKEAQDVLDRARKSAEIMDEKARNAYETLEEEGYEAGLDRANEEAMKRMISNVERAGKYLNDIECDIAEMVIMAVRDILGEFDEVELARRMVHKLCSVVQERQNLILRVDVGSFMAVSSALEQYQNDFPKLKIISDSHLANGSFVLESDMEIIDGSVNGQIDVLKRALEKHFRV